MQNIVDYRKRIIQFSFSQISFMYLIFTLDGWEDTFTLKVFCVRKYLCTSLSDLQHRVLKEEINFGFRMCLLRKRKERKMQWDKRFWAENLFLSYVWGQRSEPETNNDWRRTKGIKQHLRKPMTSRNWFFPCSILLSIVLIFLKKYYHLK